MTQGEFWTLFLPGTYHEEGLNVKYQSVELGQAATFTDYDSSVHRLTIQAGASKEENIGSYQVKLQLVDAAGYQSE